MNLDSGSVSVELAQLSEGVLQKNPCKASRINNHFRQLHRNVHCPSPSEANIIVVSVSSFVLLIIKVLLVEQNVTGFYDP